MGPSRNVSGRRIETAEKGEKDIVDPHEYRKIIGGFATGISVITARDGNGAAVGMTANSLTSVSLEPVLLAVCFQRGSGTCDAIVETGAFVVNLLSEDQEDLSNRFARSADGDRFIGLDVRETDKGIPVFAGGLGHLECVVHDVLEGGDHLIVLGQVESGQTEEGRPLLYFKGAYRQLS